MKKILYVLSALVLLASCEEWGPVFTGSYDDPEPYAVKTMTANVTIAELAQMYKDNGKSPFIVKENLVVAGKVTTTDQPGNFYKSFYIQDETGGIEVKVGKNALYNDYKLGQTVYVKLRDLKVGMYGYKYYKMDYQGMVQIGYDDPSSSYETSYLESPLLIDSHIIRGERGPQLAPTVLTEKELPYLWDTQATNKYVGAYVTLKGLKYANQTFVLMYLDSSSDKSAYSNRVFLSSTNGSTPTNGITTWAMSKARMTEYLYAGTWDACKIGSGSSFTGQTLGDLKGDGTYPGVEKAAYSVSHYFKMGNTEIQLRTSGFSKFCDYEIPQEVLDGKATLDVTGILTLYQGSIQFVVNSLDDITVSK